VPGAHRYRTRLPTMPPRLRKLLLTAHIAVSVGWLGGGAGFLVLNIAAVTSQDAETVRGAYLALNPICRYLIVPRSLASLATGLFQALATPWGLLRHHWVLAKFLLALLATFALLVHQFEVVARAANLVSAAGAGPLPSAELRPLGTQLVGDASLAT